MLPPHIAEHSPHDLEWGCVDSVLALSQGMFGIRAECKWWCVWCRFSVPHQRTFYHWNGKRAVWSRCVDGYIHPRMFGESFVVESRRMHPAMCGGSIRTRLPGHPISHGDLAWLSKCPELTWLFPVGISKSKVYFNKLHTILELTEHISDAMKAVSVTLF
jgi:hypothetical protein